MRVSMRAIATFFAGLGLAAAVGAAAGGLYDYSDDELSGPEQPIEFSHQVHARALSIDCQYCHSTVAKSQHASIPAVSVCLGCHDYVKKRSSGSEQEIAKSEQEIAKIQEYYQSGQSIPWIRVHGVPEHVQFKHFRHVNAGVECQTCHGPVETMNRVWLVPDTVSASAYLPAAKLEMGWCMDCHLREGASDDCAACHY